MVDRDRDEAGGPDPEGAFEPGRADAHLHVLEEAARLARAHFDVEPGLRAVYRLEGPDPNGPRIKLLEVNEQTVPTGVVPVGFPPHPASGLHYPSVIIEVTPREYEAIRRSELSLPDLWQVREEYPRPTGPHDDGCPS